MSLFDSLSVRIVASLVAAAAALLIYYSFDIYQFFARKDFGNVSVYQVIFSRHDKNATRDEVIFDGLDYKIPLREICRNRFIFWYIVYRSFRVSTDGPVLNFGSWGDSVLATVRGRLYRMWASMSLKRAAGFAAVRKVYWLCLVYDLSEDRTSYVIKVFLVQDRDIRKFRQYLKNPPRNAENFAFVQKLVNAFEKQTGSFIRTRITVA